MSERKATAIRLSSEADRIIGQLSEQLGITRSSVIEMAIRQLAQQKGDEMSDFSDTTLTVTMEAGATDFPGIAEIYEYVFLGYTEADREVWRCHMAKRDAPGVAQGLRFQRQVYHVGAAERITDRTRPSLVAPGQLPSGAKPTLVS